MLIDSPHLSFARQEPIKSRSKKKQSSEQSTSTIITCAPITSQRRTMVKPGIWSDGSISPHLPLVQSCLAQARIQRRIPPTPCVIFALAALDVYSAYTDIAHWLFWGPRVKTETARTVDFVLNHRGVSVKSPVSWLGINENLYIIGAQQIAWRTQLSEMSWYHSLVVQTSERRILRKRKAAPVSFDFDTADIELPARKRPRTRRATNKPKPGQEPVTEHVSAIDRQLVNEPPAPAVVVVDQYGDGRLVNRAAREGSILSSLSSLSSAPSLNGREPCTRASSEVSEDTAVSSSTSRRRRSCSGSSAETAVGGSEPKEGLLDDVMIKSERLTRAARRSRARPKQS